MPAPPTKASQTAPPMSFAHMRRGRGSILHRLDGTGEELQGAAQWTPFKVRANGLSTRHTSFRFAGRKRLQHQQEEQSSDDGG